MECPDCEETFEGLGVHWRHNPSHRPDVSDEQLDILTGIMMSDGSIEPRGNPNISISSVNKEYLTYVDYKLGCLSCGVKFQRTASQSAELSRSSGLSQNAKAENYSDVYRLRTRTHPKFNKYVEWYDESGKTWPKNIELSPIMLKHYYVCDGSLDTNPINRVQFSLDNESNHKHKVESIFRSAGFNVNVNVRTRKSGKYSGNERASVRLNKEQTQQFFRYVGEPIRGFEYKWPASVKR